MTLVFATVLLVVMGEASCFTFPWNHDTTSQDQGLCYGPCKQPKTIPLAQSELVLTQSPIYPIVLPLDNRTKNMDSVCYTFFEFTGTTVLSCISIVYKNGSSEQTYLINDDVPYQLGRGVGASTNCTLENVGLDLGKQLCENSYIAYRCFRYGVCGKLDTASHPGVDTLLAISSEPKVSEECKEELKTTMENLSDYNNDKGYVVLPQCLHKQCVTCLNGMPCINSEKVKSEDSISIS